MRLFTLIAALLSACTFLPSGSGLVSAPKNYYVIKDIDISRSDLAPVDVSQDSPTALFKTVTVTVDQGPLGLSGTQIKLVKKACAYLNSILNEDVISYGKSDADVKFIPDEFVCCLGVTSTWVDNQSNRLVGTIELKTQQEDDQFYATTVHELGHVFGLGHSRATGSVMAEYAELPPTTTFNEQEIRTLQYLRSLK